MTPSEIKLITDYINGQYGYYYLTRLGDRGTVNYPIFPSISMSGIPELNIIEDGICTLKLNQLHPRHLGYYYRTSCLTSATRVSSGIVFDTLNSTYLLEKTVV